MSKVCAITGVRPSGGNNVSHSNRHTRRRFLPNLQKKKVFNPKTGEYEVVRVSARGLRIFQKQMIR